MSLEIRCSSVKNVIAAIIDSLQGSFNVSLPALAKGSTDQNVANVAFDYTVDGIRYTKAAIAAGTAPGNDVIPEDLYGAVALDIGVNGTVDIIEAPNNSVGYATAALAVAGLPAKAASHARMGTVTAMKDNGAFTFGTTALDAANTTVAYIDGDTPFSSIDINTT